MSMEYICKGCSYRGKASALTGECPACGSFNMIAVGGEQDVTEDSPPRWRMTLLVLLWTYFLLLIAWKLLT